jgi:Family of unknown function (DUF6077)
MYLSVGPSVKSRALDVSCMVPAVAESAARIARSSILQLGLVTDAVVIVYAAWTLIANTAVIAGGTSDTLVDAAVFGALVLGVAIAVVLARKGVGARYLADIEDQPLPGPRPALRRVVPALAFAGAALAGWLITRSPIVAFTGLVLSALAGAWCARVDPFAAGGAEGTRESDNGGELLALHMLALFCALFTLCSYRPRSDDTLYLHLAVSVVDYPQLPLLSTLTLHGLPYAALTPQAMFPPYRVHSFELLGGVLSRLTGLPAAAVIHLGIATFFSWVLPFASGRLLRILFPRKYLLALFVLISFYVIEGTASRGYANHALVRMFNGKSVLLSVALPLICAYALRFAARPTAWRFALLALCQVAAVGLSSTALWLAPTAAMIATVAGTRGAGPLAKRVLASALSSGYVIAIGLWVMSHMALGGPETLEFDSASEATEPASAQPEAAAASAGSGFAQLAEAIDIALGPERTAIALLAVAAVAGPLAPNGLALRLLSGLFLAVALGFGNPLLSRLIARFVTGELTYYRLFWLLPVPLAVASCAVSLYCFLRARTRAWAAAAVFAAALAGFYGVAVGRLVISEGNRAKLQFPPGLKLWAHAHGVAEEVCRFAPVGRHVLASEAVMLQLPTIHGCGHPLVAHERWLSSSEQDEQRRADLVRYVGDAGDVPLDRMQAFVDSLAYYQIDVVALSREGQVNARVKSLVRFAGFERVSDADWEQIYAQTRPSTRKKQQRVAATVCRHVTTDGGTPVLAPFGVSSALQKLGCARIVAAPQTMGSLTPQEFDDVLRLERGAYLATETDGADEAWLLAELNRRGIQVVVLSARAMGNRRFKAMLRVASFVPVQVVQAHTILRRPPQR